MPFKLFDYVDVALVESESRDPRTSRTPAVWPSEASALRIDNTARDIVGACHRKSFLRMMGFAVSNQVDPVGAWRWVTGRMIETHLTTLAQKSDPKIYVASGVRTFIKDIYLPLELDLVVIDPNTKRGCIVECKTYYGYMAKKDIETSGKPKLENLMQASLYLLEIKTGAKLKQIIREGIAERGKDPRNRIDVNLDLLDQMDDGPLTCKLVYISRDECLRKEFDISVEESFDGSHYPLVDGDMWKIFTVDSIYERFKTLQNYWYIARREGVKRLEAKGIARPDTMHLVLFPGDPSRREIEIVLSDEQKVEEEEYLKSLEQEVRLLPDSFWPPAEYQWAYPPEKVEKLYSIGEIGKVKYTDWKKKKSGKDRIGDWQCLYCPYKKVCVPKNYPNFTYLLADMDDINLTNEE